MINGLIIDRIVQESIRDSPPQILEIGPGLGALTAALLRRARHVVAIERDRDLVPVLAEAFAGPIAQWQLSLLEADAQTVDVPALLGPADDGAPRVLAGNLPYQITGRLLQLAVTHSQRLERAVFMVQDEVADRLLASP